MPGSDRVIYTLRHAAIDFGSQHIIAGRMDPPINAEGVEQIRQMAAAGLSLEYDLVISSPQQRALQTANRLQDIVTQVMHPGQTGNEALSAALTAMQNEGIDGTVYSHPVGDHGHGAGPLIGLWDRQDGVPGRGDVPIRANTWYAIELQAASRVPEWDDQLVRMMLEEDAEVAADGTVRWILRRQSEFHLVR